MLHEVTLRRPTLQLRCRAGLTLPAAVPALGTGRFSDWTLSGLPLLLLLRLIDPRMPAGTQRNKLIPDGWSVFLMHACKRCAKRSDCRMLSLSIFLL